MKDRDYLNNILAGNGFTWVQLNSVSSYVRGLTYNKASESRDGNGYKVLRANNITLSRNMLNFDDVKVVKFDTKVKNSQKLHKNDILISAASGSREHVGKVAFIDMDMDYYFGGFMGVVRSKKEINPRFLFHILRSRIFQDYLNEMLNSSTINNLSSSVMNGFQIPIPCPENPERSLQIQAEIVRILDAFTSLTAELTAELTARKKQYNYYRDKLLSFEDGEVEWKPLGEVVNIKNGKDWKSLGAGDVPVYGSGGVMTYVDSFAYDEPTVLIPRKGSITNIFYVDEPFWNVDTIYYTEIDTTQLVPKFFYYFMRTIDLMKLDTGSGRPSLTQAILNNIPVPVPSIKKQEHIVGLLDKFDALTNSITEGLPREIELRQKQYEYYRDLLLSFPKSDEQVA